MHLVYLDESGNSGTNLSDAQQPVFVLGALLVGEEKWHALEKAIEGVIAEFFPPPRPLEFEIHAAGLRNGKGFFRQFSVAHRLAFRDRCLTIAVETNLTFVYRAIEKKRFLKWLVQNFGEGILINPHVVAFPLVAQVVNAFLSGEAQDYGVLISDENVEISPDIEKTTQFLRGVQGKLNLDRIIEKGFFIDSRKSWILQLCDLVTFSARKKEEQQAGFPIRSTDESGITLMDPLIHRGDEVFKDVVAWITEEQKRKAARD